jgi:RNA polymerase sigma-70 factor (ECF subfamily)
MAGRLASSEALCVAPCALRGSEAIVTPSDQDLMERIRKRDAAAFEVLFARHRATLRQHLARIVRDAAAVDDLVQEVFLRVWTRSEQWSGQGAFKAWLFRIATNLALNHLRWVGRRRERPLEVLEAAAGESAETTEASWLIDASAPGPEAHLEQEASRQQIERLVDALPREKREVFQMAHEGQMEIHEIADALGIPEGTVKSRLHYARKRLAEAWREMSEEQ